MIRGDLADWLLDSDPALRWQVEHDLLGASKEEWQATRARVATERFGVELLARQDSDGQWAGSAFCPAGWDWNSHQPQPSTATTWVLKDLRDWGLDASALRENARSLHAQALGVRRSALAGRRGVPPVPQAVRALRDRGTVQ